MLECTVIRPVYLQQSDIYKTTQRSYFLTILASKFFPYLVLKVVDRELPISYSSHWLISIIVVGRLLGARAVFSRFLSGYFRFRTILALNSLGT